MEKVLIRQLDELLKCAICKERVTQPKVLPCLHTFCFDCLNKLAQCTPRGTLDCPLCRERHAIPQGGVSKFQTNFTFQNLSELLVVCESTDSRLTCSNGVDDKPALGKCLQCEVYLCKECLELHKKQVATRGHHTVLLEQIRKEGENTLRHPHFCQVHESEEIKLYCQNCRKAICRDCTLVEHREHNYTFIKNVLPELEKRLDEALTTFLEKEKQFTEHVDYIKLVSKKSELQHEKVRKEVQATCAKYIKELEQQRDKLLGVLKEQAEAKMKVYAEQRDTVTLILTKLRSSVQFCQQLKKSGSDAEKAQMDNQVSERMQNLKSTTWEKGTVYLTEWQLEDHGLGALLESQMVVSSTNVQATNFSIESGTAHCGILGHCQFGIRAVGDFKSVCPPATNFVISVKFSTKSSEDEEVQSLLACTVERVDQMRWTVSYFVKVRGRCEVSVMVKGKPITGSPFSADVQKLAVGTCVQRGPSWKWGDQDSNGSGVVTDLDQLRRWVTVRWNTGHVNGYRWGADSAYDLEPVELGK